MNEANLDVSGPDGDEQAEATREMQDDRLMTTRLPPITPPPLRHPSGPPSSLPPSSTHPPSYPPAGASYRDDVSPSARPGLSTTARTRNSWWKALLTATLPPQSMPPAAPTDDRMLRRRIGATCGGMALGFVILALALGLRGAEPAFVPAVSAALIIARAFVALGFLAFGYGLLRMGERFFMARSNDASTRNGGPQDFN